MKSCSIAVYTLINTLSKTERRYFTIKARQHTLKQGNGYLKLYNAILETGATTDEELMHLHTDEPYMNYFATAKAHLFSHILKSLDTYHRVGSPKEQLKAKLHHVEILLDKGLKKEAASLLTRIKKKAVLQEFFVLYPEIFALKQRLLAGDALQKTTLKELAELEQQIKHFWHQYANYNSYWLLFNRIYKIHLQEVKTKKQSDKEQLGKWFNDPILTNESMAKSISAKLLFWQLKALMYFTKNQSEQAANSNKQLLSLLDQHPHILALNPRRYLSVLNNYLIDCLILDRNRDLEDGLLRIRELPRLKAYKKLPNTERDVFRLSYSLEMNRFLSEGNFEALYAIRHTVELGVKKWGSQLSDHHLVAFYYMIAYSCFALTKYEECLDWTNRIMAETDEKSAAALQISGRLLNLLAHYELGNNELLEYAINNVRRYQKRREKLTQLEALILSSLTSLIHLPSGERKKTYLSLESKLSALKEDSSEKTLFHNFNYPAWVKMKLTKESFSSIYKRIIA